MPHSTESTPASSAATGAIDECDFCGRAVHRATAVEAVQRGSSDPEVIRVCAECAVGVD